MYKKPPEEEPESTYPVRRRRRSVVPPRSRPKKGRIIITVSLIFFILLLFISFLVAAVMALRQALGDYPDYWQSLASIEYDRSEYQAVDEDGKTVDLTNKLDYNRELVVVDVKQIQLSDQTVSLHLQICLKEDKGDF